MEKTSIDNLPNYIKAARELAILGGYQKSLEIYKKIFYQIQARMDEISNDNYLLDKWKETTEKLKKECALILNAYQNCKIFQIDVEEDKQKKIEEERYINNFMMRDNKRVNKPEITKVNENPKRWEHFGGKPPFSYLKQKSEDNIGKNLVNSQNNLNNNYINDNYIDNDRYKNSNNDDNVNYLNDFYSDPDVWASPEDDPRFSYQKNTNKKNNNYPSPLTKKRRSVKVIDSKCDLGVVNEENVERRRQNYERPWQNTNNNNNALKNNNNKKNNNNTNQKYTQQRRKTLPNKELQSKKKNNNNNNNKQPSNKSAFLLNRYPEDDGNGPDTELIEMIEREVVDMNPNVSFDDIAELETAKRALTEAVVLPLLMPDFFVGLRRPWKGVLLYGPPGTGKTLLAKALATQGKTTFFNVSPTTFASKWKGESEKLVRILFEMARFYAPSTIFIDEVDSVGVKRSDKENEASKKVLAEMLVQMDGISDANINLCESENGKNEQKFVMVLAATNLPWDLDDALRRRFEKRIYIPLPNSIGRMQMFYINFKGIKLSNDVDIETLVKKTEGYSGHDISSVCREASLMNMRRKLMSTNGHFDILEAANNENFLHDLEAPVSQNDLLLAIKNISKSVSSNDVKKFEEWTEQYSSK